MVTPTVENVLSTYYDASFWAWSEGMDWYDRAHNTAKSIDPLRFQRAAGVISALSPMNKWDNNVAKARQFYDQNGVIVWNGTKNGIGLSGSVEKAVRIYNGEDALDVFSNKTAKKTRAFFLSIIEPDGDHIPVIDRHAFDIAIGVKTNDAARSILGRKGMYERFANVYRDAADILGIPPAKVQAITWTSWREIHNIED